MKAIFKFSLLFLAISTLTFACKDNTKGEQAETKEAVGEAATAPATAESYNVDGSASSINWTGSKPTGKTHMGTIKLSEGAIAVANGNIVSGEFSIDMNSLSNKDLEDNAEMKGKLEGHLKSPDFFDVATYPTGKFVITNVAAATGKPNVTHTITGDLTLRDQTKSITFDANVAIVNNTLRAVTPSFKINRTNWGVNYNSGILGTIKDQLINDDVALVISLVANKS